MCADRDKLAAQVATTHTQLDGATNAKAAAEAARTEVAANVERLKVRAHCIACLRQP